MYVRRFPTFRGAPEAQDTKLGRDGEDAFSLSLSYTRTRPRRKVRAAPSAEGECVQALIQRARGGRHETTQTSVQRRLAFRGNKAASGFL